MARDLATVGPRGFVLRYVHGRHLWVSPSVDRIIRPAALAAAVRDHEQLAARTTLPVFSSWYELPLIGRYLKGSRLRVGIRTQFDFDETLVGLASELPRRRGGRPGRRAR